MPSALSTSCRLDEALLSCSCNCVSVLATARAMRWWFKSTLSCIKRGVREFGQGIYANRALLPCPLEDQHSMIRYAKGRYFRRTFCPKCTDFPDVVFLIFVTFSLREECQAFLIFYPLLNFLMEDFFHVFPCISFKK